MRTLSVCIWVCFVAAVCGAQYRSTPKEMQVSNMHFVSAGFSHPIAELSAALETMLANPDICCGKKSSLVDVVAACESCSLRELGTKLAGRHVLPDGRPFLVSADYEPKSTTGPADPVVPKILLSIHAQHPLLLRLDSHLYVIYGVTYTEAVPADNQGAGLDTIEKLQLFEPATGKSMVFDRTKDDWSKVEGVLTLTTEPSPS